jgi:hypothetical protein
MLGQVVRSDLPHEIRRIAGSDDRSSAARLLLRGWREDAPSASICASRSPRSGHLSISTFLAVS